eukprot:468158-Alexandrium_andersonii.AAC.1
MSASLVGSEMCKRDRAPGAHGLVQLQGSAPGTGDGGSGGQESMLERLARLLAGVSKDGRDPAEVLKQIGEEVNAAAAAGKEDKDKDGDGSAIKRADGWARRE